eukprot:240150_1
MESWFIQTKQKLLKQETENINRRLAEWQIIVNKSTHSDISRLTRTNINFEKFTTVVTESEMKNILSFVNQWNGLKHQSNLSLTAYELKSKNWLTGSRAKHYSQTLFPFMINAAEIYAKNISIKLFPVNNCAILFFNILMYSYLHELFSFRLRVSQTGRRVFLLCEQSIIAHKNNTTNRLLQKYATDHKYVDKFPLHRQDAIGYFKQQKDKYFASLFVLLQEIKLYQMNNTNGLLDVIKFVQDTCKINNGKQIVISKRVMMSIHATLKHTNDIIMKNKKIINDLQAKLSTLQMRQSNISTEVNAYMPTRLDNQLLNMDIDNNIIWDYYNDFNDENTVYNTI